MSGNRFVLSSTPVMSQLEAQSLCFRWHTSASLAYWDTITMFENMAAMLDLSGAGSDALSPGSAVAAWTGAVWRQDSWWWLSTKQPADPSVFNWGLKFPVNAASAPAVMAYQQGQEWFMANMPAGSPGYALCQLPGECCAGAGVVEGASDGELCQQQRLPVQAAGHRRSQNQSIAMQSVCNVRSVGTVLI